MRGSEREGDEGMGKWRLGEVRVFSDLDFEREKCKWRIFFIWISVCSGEDEQGKRFKVFFLVYIYMCVCVCVCVEADLPGKRGHIRH